MTPSHDAQRLERSCATPAPNCRSLSPLGSTLFVWLVQTAFLAVIEGACETLQNQQGLPIGGGLARRRRRTISLNFSQNTLISRLAGRKFNLSTVGYVAGGRRLRRVVRGWF